MHKPLPNNIVCCLLVSSELPCCSAPRGLNSQQSMAQWAAVTWGPSLPEEARAQAIYICNWVESNCAWSHSLNAATVMHVCMCGVFFVCVNPDINKKAKLIMIFYNLLQLQQQYIGLIVFPNFSSSYNDIVHTKQFFFLSRTIKLVIAAKTQVQRTVCYFILICLFFLYITLSCLFCKFNFLQLTVCFIHKRGYKHFVMQHNVFLLCLLWKNL